MGRANVSVSVLPYERLRLMTKVEMVEVEINGRIVQIPRHTAQALAKEYYDRHDAETEYSVVGQYLNAKNN